MPLGNKQPWTGEVGRKAALSSAEGPVRAKHPRRQNSPHSSRGPGADQRERDRSPAQKRLPSQVESEEHQKKVEFSGHSTESTGPWRGPRGADLQQGAQAREESTAWRRQEGEEFPLEDRPAQGAAGQHQERVPRGNVGSHC